MSPRSWAAGIPLNEALGVFRLRGQSEGGLTVTEVWRAWVPDPLRPGLAS
jgi:hypothetical protein